MRKERTKRTIAVERTGINEEKWNRAAPGMDRAMRSLEQAKSQIRGRETESQRKTQKGGEPPQVYDGRHHRKILSRLLPV